jgi:hypothetical protein
MNHFIRVEADQAGPTALGILVPPAKRTFVILRPRALELDLVVCRSSDDSHFADFAHDEASAVAQSLWKHLRDWDALSGFSLHQGTLRFALGGFLLVACPRIPGQPYHPLPATDADLVALREAISPGEAGREVYFNMRHFERA